MLIDDLSTGCLMHKFVDDSTLSEIIGKDGVSHRSRIRDSEFENS